MPAAGTAQAHAGDLRAAASRRVVPPPDSLPCPGIGNVPFPATPPDTRAEPPLLIHATGQRGRGERGGPDGGGECPEAAGIQAAPRASMFGLLHLTCSSSTVG